MFIEAVSLGAVLLFWGLMRWGSGLYIADDQRENIWYRDVDVFVGSTEFSERRVQVGYVSVHERWAFCGHKLWDLTGRLVWYISFSIGVSRRLMKRYLVTFTQCHFHRQPCSCSNTGFSNTFSYPSLIGCELASETQTKD